MIINNSGNYFLADDYNPRDPQVDHWVETTIDSEVDKMISGDDSDYADISDIHNVGNKAQEFLDLEVADTVEDALDMAIMHHKLGLIEGNTP